MKINLTKEFKEKKVYRYTGTTLSRDDTYTFRLWEKYGKCRVYLNKSNGKTEGYIDVLTGERFGLLSEDHNCYNDLLDLFFENCVEHEDDEKTETTEEATEETAEEKPERVVEAEDGNYKFVQIDYKDRKELKKYEFVNGKYQLMSWLVKDLKTGKLRTKH